MADLKVQQVQEWLLSTYGNRSEFAAFASESDFEANGITDNTTVTALIYALQYELGISGVTGNFGPTTISLAPKISFSNAGNYSENIIKILEGGLWCHGYSAGYNEDEDSFGGTYDSDTDAAVKQLQNDIGINPSGNFDGYLWKALLSTDAYVTTWTGGSEKLREAQQYLNGLAITGYFFTDDFLGGYLPTDGLNSRQFSSALIYYLQANMGMYASEATGFIGEATKASLITVPDQLPGDVTTARHYVRIIVFALLANGYDLTINSYWSEETAAAVAQFQRDMALPQAGKVGVTTWMALLVSYGDKNRPYTACDTRFEITDARLGTLKAMGIQAVGRYINGTDFKVLRDGEVQRIINGGLSLIPIYQENGISTSDFSESIGRSQALKANESAKKFGIPVDSIIYFAVDYDAQDWEISEYILPYFKGVSEALTNYRVGVYGTRNVCSQVTSSGYAVTSYVSNMSSGFSGNLGFKMPENWNFDQFDEIEIADWAIDKVVYSGLYPAVNSYYQSNDRNMETVIEKIKDLEALVMDYREYRASTGGMIVPSPYHYYSINLVLDYLRRIKYSGIVWDSAIGLLSEGGFIDFVEKNNPSLNNYFLSIISSDEESAMVIDCLNGWVDLAHLAYTTLGYSLENVNSPRFWTGWGGDFATYADQIAKERIEMEKNGSYNEEEIRDIAYKLLGSKTGSTFNYSDIVTDADAVYIGNTILNRLQHEPDLKLSTVLSQYYPFVTSKQRYENYLVDLGLSNSLVLTKSDIFDALFSTVTNLVEIGLWGSLGPNANQYDIKVAAECFADFIYHNTRE